MARGVDEIELITAPVRRVVIQGDALGLNGDPRSRSKSMESSTCSAISRSLSPPHTWISRSERVDLPWSIWAMMEKFRMCDRSVTGGPLTLRPRCGSPGARRAALPGCQPEETLPVGSARRGAECTPERGSLPPPQSSSGRGRARKTGTPRRTTRMGTARPEGRFCAAS